MREIEIISWIIILSKTCKFIFFQYKQVIEHFQINFNSMCQFIDESFFYIQRNMLNIQSKTNYSPKKDNKTSLEDSLFGFKPDPISKNSMQKHKYTTLIRLPQHEIDLFLQASFSGSLFIIIVKNLYNFSLVPVCQRQLRKILIKQFSKKSFISMIEPNKIIFSLQTGEWFIKTPLYYNQQKQKQFNNEFHRAVQNLLKKLNESLQYFWKITRYKEQQISESKKIKIHQTLRYYVRCTTTPSISVKSDCTEYQSAINRYAASNCDIQDLIGYNEESKKTTLTYFGSVGIYGFDITKDNKVKYLDEVILRQKQRIQEEISIPSFGISRPNQNKFIFNHCYFLNTGYQQLKINEGGNAELFVLKPQLYEYSSASWEANAILEKSSNISKYIIKHLVYKKPREDQVINMIQERQLQNRQTEVVSYLRSGSCLFLPKYYLNIDKQSPYSQKLFLDYLPGQTLDHFLNLNYQTVSIYTKIYLILQVLQALRFISGYGIVHLDIKENNIMVLKKMICKIFDFGQSYHYKVCGTKHKPKYTLLYASPQIVTSINGRVFTQKSDIFSLGIMIHNILFHKHPYSFFDQPTFQRCNFEGKLRQKTFYLPEQYEEYGDRNIIKILTQMILKCIDIDESKRPYLDWITLVFKTCFNYLTSQ